MKKYESVKEQGVFFWADKIPRLGRPAVSTDRQMWNVVCQARGGPVHEAHDDWFANEADAEAAARELAGMSRKAIRAGLFEATEPKTAHTPGALSAARIIEAQTGIPGIADSVAAIIDRETHAPELLAALEAVTDYAMRLVRERNGEQVNEPDCVQEARAAIARAKGLQS